MSDEDPKTQIIQIPFSGGLQEKTESEWLDPNQGQASITNGQFTKQGSIQKRLGMQWLTTFASRNVLSTSQSVSWSRQNYGAASTYTNGDAYLNFFNWTQYQNVGNNPIPSPRTVRRPWTSIPNSAANPAVTTTITPIICDCAGISIRLVFSVLGASTYVSQLDLTTGDPVGIPLVLVANVAASVITAFELANHSVIVLLQIAGESHITNTMLGYTLTNVGTTHLTVTNHLTSTVACCADATPLVGDSDAGWLLLYQTAGGVWVWTYKNAAWSTSAGGDVETTPTTDSSCSITGTYSSVTGAPGVAFMYTYRGSGDPAYYILRFIDYSAERSFTILDAHYTVAEFTNKFFLTGLVWSPATTTFVGGIFQMQPVGSNADPDLELTTPQWLQMTFVSGTETTFTTDTAMDSNLGLFPVGRPFVFPGQNSDVFQPCVSQLGALYSAATLGSANFGAQSEQCSLYLMNLSRGIVVSAAAVRQVDPVFSWSFFQFVTGSFPQSTYSTNLVYGTRFAIGINTNAEDVPGVGISQDPSWYVDWFFDPLNQGLLYQSNEIQGSLRLQASVPMISDGELVVEDNFFYYPEFSWAYQPDTGTLWPNAAGTYIWAVCYVYVDGTGQLHRSSPVFTPLATGETYTLSVSDAGIGVYAPIVVFPPLGLTYKTSVNAEIYRTTAGGGTFYLVQTVSGQYSSIPTTYSVVAVTVIGGGSYSSATPPTVSFSGGGGSGAEAYAVMGGGGISAVNLTGSNYYNGNAGTWPLSFSGTGFGAAGYFVVTYNSNTFGNQITQTVITNPGTLYYGTVTADFSAGGASYPGSTTTTTPIVVAGVEMQNGGSGYTSTPTVAFSGGGATGIATLNSPAPTESQLSYVDTASDAAIVQSTVLYTTGGILDSVNPPSASCQCIHWNRLWIVDETLTTIWFTTQFVAGEAPRFNEALTIYFPDGGDITAIAGMDDKLIIFKLGGIYVVYGQGPAETGQGSDLTQPQPIATDSGAIDYRSVCLFPGGLFFQSPTGLYVLDRSLQVSWVGKAVVDTLNAYPTIVEATLVPTATHVRFICQNPNSQNTIVLVYDYLVNQWTTFTYPHQPAPLTSAGYISTLVQNNQGYPTETGVYATLTADGSLWSEDNTINDNDFEPPYVDSDTLGNLYFVPTSITTAWVKLQGIQGYQRLRRTMLQTEMLDPAGLYLGIAVNYNGQVVQFGQWTDQVIGNLPRPQVEMHTAGAYNKQMSVQVTVSDVGGNLWVSGQGASFVSVALELQNIGDRFPQVPPAGRA